MRNVDMLYFIHIHITIIFSTDSTLNLSIIININNNNNLKFSSKFQPQSAIRYNLLSINVLYIDGVQCTRVCVCVRLIWGGVL